MAAGSSTLPSETVTLKLPTGEHVDAVVPGGLSDADVKSYVQMKRPDLLGPPAGPVSWLSSVMGTAKPGQTSPQAAVGMHESYLMGDPSIDPNQTMTGKIANRIGQQGETLGKAADLIAKDPIGSFTPQSNKSFSPKETIQRIYGSTLGPLVNDVTSIRSHPENILSDALIAGATHAATTGGVPATEGVPRPSQSPAPSPSSGPTVGSILARHIPVIGKYLRTMDDIQSLLGKDAPHPASATNVAPPKPALIPETNGIQWGTGGQGPLDLRGKMIPDQPSPYQVVPLSGPKVPAAQGATPILPDMQPSQSTTIAMHGYDAAKQQMFMQFKNGNVYRYSGVPQKVFEQYQQSESQGSFHANNIKGRYQTDLIGKVKPTPGQKVTQALGGPR